LDALFSCCGKVLAFLSALIQFLTIVDIVEAKANMIFALLASLMKWWRENKTG
jgi:hypothetical protein